MSNVSLPTLAPGASPASTQSAFGSASPTMAASTGDLRRAAARLATAPEQRARSTFSAFSAEVDYTGQSSNQDFLGRLALTDDNFRRARRKTLATDIVHSLQEGSRRDCERCSKLQKTLDDSRRSASKELEHLRRGLEKLMDQLSLYLPGPRLTKLVEGLQLDVRYLTRPLEGEASPQASEVALALFRNNQEQESGVIQKLKKQIAFLEDELKQLRELAEKCGFGPGTKIGADGFPIGFRKEVSTQWLGADVGLWDDDGEGGGFSPNGEYGKKARGGKGGRIGGGVGPNGEPLDDDDGADDANADPDTLRLRLSRLRAENARLLADRKAAEEKMEEEARLHREAARLKDEELEALRRQLAQLTGLNGGIGGKGAGEALTPEEQAAAEAAARERALLEADADGKAGGRRGKEGSRGDGKNGRGNGAGGDSSDEDEEGNRRDKGKRLRSGKGKSKRRLLGADGEGGSEDESGSEAEMTDKCVGGGPGPGLAEVMNAKNKSANGKEMNKNGKCYLREVRSTPSLGVSLQDGSLSPGPSTSTMDGSRGTLGGGTTALLGGSISDVGREFGSCLQKPRRLVLGGASPPLGGWNVGFGGVVNAFDGQLLPLGGKQIHAEPYLAEVLKKKSERRTIRPDVPAAPSIALSE